MRAEATTWALIAEILYDKTMEKMRMFVNTIEFPVIRQESDSKFREWFKSLNEIYRKFDGFISRRLLKRTKGGEANYVVLVQHESEQTFMRMHTSAERQQAYERLKPLLGSASLKVQFFEVVES